MAHEDKVAVPQDAILKWLLLNSNPFEFALTSLILNESYVAQKDDAWSQELKKCSRSSDTYFRLKAEAFHEYLKVLADQKAQCSLKYSSLQ